MKQRKTYDSKVKYLAKRDLLPDLYRKQIHRSMIWRWKQESNEKYIGYELNLDVEQLYELMKKFSDDGKMQKIVKTIYRINKTLRDAIGTGKKYMKKIREHKYKIVDAINRGKKTIGIKWSFRAKCTGNSAVK